MKLFVYSILLASLVGSCRPQVAQTNNKEITPGAWQTDKYLPLLKNKRVAFVVNQSATIKAVNLIDSLLSLGVNITAIFSPEHGFRGNADAGKKIDDSIDEATGIPIISLYGAHRKPSQEDLAGVDMVIFDIQDVGVRFYTYISTMHYVMEACAENNKPLIILDRPNPNGNYVGGPVLDMNFKSFVGMHPIPIVHGLTVGELALMINGEHWLDTLQCDLTIIKTKNYTHKSRYELPIKPSPNLPNARSIRLYPSLCFFEATNISIGRGTPFPFQVIGYPDSTFGDFTFKPVSTPGAATHPKHQDQLCYGIDLRNGTEGDFFTIQYVLDFYQLVDNDTLFFTRPSGFDRLAGSDELRKQISTGKTAKEIEQSWQKDLDKYKTMRKKYLLYDDFE